MVLLPIQLFYNPNGDGAKPIYDEVKIRRVVVSTYQAVSGTGVDAIEELKEQLKMILDGENPKSKVYPYPIAFNVLPHRCI